MQNAEKKRRTDIRFPFCVHHYAFCIRESFFDASPSRGYGVGSVEPLLVRAVDHPSGLIIKVTGDAGVENVSALDIELNRIASRHPPVVVFDLSGLEFIASLGMGTLMSFRQTITRNGGVVRIAAAKPAVLDVFKRAALKALFNTCDTVDEALQPKRA
jgi:anti-sigma B factor antagonist